MSSTTTKTAAMSEKKEKAPAAAAAKGDDKIAAARKKNLDLAITQIQKDFGEAAIMRLGDDTRMDVDSIPTGNLVIDRALGVGGFPRGRIVEVFGGYEGYWGYDGH